MQRQFQDLKVILDLSPSTSKINILKEAQLECSTLKMQSDCLVSAFDLMSGQLLKPVRCAAGLQLAPRKSPNFNKAQNLKSLPKNLT